MVTNDQGLCLIRTTHYGLADFVDSHSKGINPEFRLRVGGDPGTKTTASPIWTFVRKTGR
jgi:hypothetical protein